MSTREKDVAHARRTPTESFTNAEHFADGCAHRDRQVVAFLRELALRTGDYRVRAGIIDAMEALERGEHVKP